MASYKYSEIYGHKDDNGLLRPLPPKFCRRQKIDDGQFGQGLMRIANTAIMNDKWQLTPISTGDTDATDPLAGLHRMGLLDLLEHQEAEQVTLVITNRQNARMTNTFKSLGREMKRKNGKKILVVPNAKVKPVTRTQATNLSGKVQFSSSDGTKTFSLDLDKAFSMLLNSQGEPKVEIWKPIPRKIQQVSTFLSTDLLKDQPDVGKRTAVFAHLLSESMGDVAMALAISKAYYRYRFDITTSLLESRVRQGMTLEEYRNLLSEEEEKAKKVVAAIEDAIERKLEKTSSGFVKLCWPLLDTSELRGLHNMIRDDLPETYKNLAKKQNKPLKEPDKFTIFLDFIMQNRRKSQKRLTPFALIVGYAVNATGGGGLAEKLLQDLRIECSDTHLREDKAKRAKKYMENLEKVLKKQKNVWITWDNFQAFVKMKFLKAGASTYSAHATTRFDVKTHEPDEFIPDSQQKQPTALKYVDQEVPAPHGMFEFELLKLLSVEEQNKFIEQLLFGEKPNSEILSAILELRSRTIDEQLQESSDSEDDDGGNVDVISRFPQYGDRTKWYMELVEIADVLSSMRRLLFRPVKEKSDGESTSTSKDVAATVAAETTQKKPFRSDFSKGTFRDLGIPLLGDIVNQREGKQIHKKQDIDFNKLCRKRGAQKRQAVNTMPPIIGEDIPASSDSDSDFQKELEKERIKRYKTSIENM